MKWVSAKDWETILPKSRVKIQTILLAADVDLLPLQIPVAAEISSSGAETLYQWFGVIGSRPIIVEYQRFNLQDNQRYVDILTPYEDTSPDWSVLSDMKNVLDCVWASRPIFVQSQIADECYVVYRPNPKGWDDPIYRAASLDEARSLLDFLLKDSWNQGVFIAKSTPEGTWDVVRENGDPKNILCNYNDKTSAFRFACEISATAPDVVFAIRKWHDKHLAAEYYVRAGRVLKEDSRPV